MINTGFNFKKYPYQNRNLFKCPENYFYADCSKQDFLETYFHYREHIINSLESISCPPPDSYPYFGSEKTELYYFFDKLKYQIQKKDLRVFDKFCGKYEVRKKFYALYDRNHLPIKESGDADPLTYINFANCLSMAFEKTNCLGYLSTLLKCCDALCSISFSYPDTEELIILLKKEVEYVRNIR